MKKVNQNIGQYLFIGILILHVVACYFIGLGILTNPKLALETGFKVTYNADIQIISVVVGMQVIFLGSIALLGVIWTRRKSMYGIYAGIAVGLYMFAFGFVSLLKVGTTDGLIVDSSRGFITLIFAYYAYKELKTSN